MEPRRRKRLLTVTAIICIGGLAADRVVLTPLQRLWTARAERLVELEQSLSKGRILVGRENDMKKRWLDMRQRSLPAQESVAEDLVLKSVTRWTRDSRLGVTSLKPRWSRKEKGFRKLEFRATAQGGIGSIAQFLYELETDPLPLKVEDVVVTARDGRGDVLALGIRFSGLVLTNEKR